MRASRVTLVLLLLGMLCLAQSASAGVLAFNAATGAEDASFVTFDSVGLPRAVVSDGANGVYVVGSLTVAGRHVRIAHVLADGTVDPSFHVAIGPGDIAGAAVRGNELALLGSFTTIDGRPRKNIAIVDARSGRLRGWAPVLPSRALGQGFSRLVFTSNRLVAGIVGAVAAYRDGSPKPVWTRRFPTGDYHDQVPEIVGWHGAIIAADVTELLLSLRPGDGHASVLARDFRWGSFQNIGGRLFYSVEGSYALYGSTSSMSCGQGSGTTAPSALAGDSNTLYVAAEPVDADPPAPPGRIYACTTGDAPVAGFTTPVLPMPQDSVDAMALVGGHLLVFTSRF